MTESPNNVEALCDRFHSAENSSDWERTSSGKYWAWRKLLETIPQGLFLDIGCGDCSVTQKIIPLVNGRCIGLDVSDQAARIARERGIELVTCDIEQGLPFADNSVDHVFCSDFIEHIVDVDYLLDEIERVLKPGGYCVLSTPNLAWLPNRVLFMVGLHPLGDELSYRYEISGPFREKRKFPAGHIHVFSHTALMRLLKLHGFEIEKCLGAQMIERKTLRRWGFPRWANLAIPVDWLCARRASWSWETVVKFRKPLE